MASYGSRKSGVNNGMGRSLVRQHRQASKSGAFAGRGGADYWTAPTEPISVTEPGDLQAFMQRAELLNADFEADRDELRVVGASEVAAFAALEGALTVAERLVTVEAQERLREQLRVPRRPAWTSGILPEEQNERERASFNVWLAAMSALEAERGIIMTPFERNLELWRQLWRVVERCDVLVQIVDARDPLLYRCTDVEDYAREVSADKENLVLLNKADLLTVEQRQQWAAYFRREGLNAVFFSALLVTTTTTEAAADDESLNTEEENMKEEQSNDDDDVKIFSRDELIKLLKGFCKKSNDAGKTTIGFIGYPNVGKSSTLNALLMDKKVSVSATPGKTKHFQTIHFDSELILCDCPGLVLPSFVATKAELILSGILPVDQMRDYLAPVALLAQRVGRQALRNHYGLSLPLSEALYEEQRASGQVLEIPPSASELLEEHATRRGFVSDKGNPHLDRSARILIKEYIQGERLRYCVPPPDCGLSGMEFNPECCSQQVAEEPRLLSTFDKAFFAPKVVGFGFKGSRCIGGQPLQQKGLDDSRRHNNRNKKEKLRRLHSHLNE